MEQLGSISMNTVQNSKIKEKVLQMECYHCGDSCPNMDIQIGEKVFCCNGCRLVYELLEEKDLCAYYSLTRAPGTTPLESGISSKYSYLGDETVKRQLLNFTDGNINKVSFKIPVIHCSSCIWLLENLYRVDPGIIESKVNFLRKELSLSFLESKTSLQKIVEVLASLGYEPEINLASIRKQVQKSTDKELYLQIGVAGFAFGNIMLLSFPEYLAGNETLDLEFLSFFGYLSIFLALPVLLYSSMGYFKSAISGLKQASINMDVPISLGIITLFSRSIWHIVAGEGGGYLDSFAGLVFLLLIGKLFQKKTYDALSFDRDYRSYFPLSVTRKVKNKEVIIPLDKLKIGDRIILANKELIPADGVLIKNSSTIDYSFVTGESTPVEKISGDILYAGGLHIGSQIEMEGIKDVSQSYLTQLWNDDAFNKHNDESKITTLANTVSRYFTFIVLSVATLSAMYWLPENISLALNAFTAVLIVACPCALALSTPFTLGNTLRIFGKNHFYLKNVSIIEMLAKVRTIVFDKTGTLTLSGGSSVTFNPAKDRPYGLNPEEFQWVRSLAKQSTHPLSRRLYSAIKADQLSIITDFREYPGQGLTGNIFGNMIKLGSERLIPNAIPRTNQTMASIVQVEIKGEYRGYFSIPHNYRKGIRRMIEKLGHCFRGYLLSGDNDGEKENLTHVFGDSKNLLFNQSPYDKLNFIKNIQQQSGKVLMIGDGLNDAGALMQSDAGITISEDVNTFTPASDGILDASRFKHLPQFLKFSKISIRIIFISFLISFIYNIAGLFFAVQGTLSPLIAAVLMPASSLTVVLFTIGATAYIGKKLGFRL